MWTVEFYRSIAQMNQDGDTLTTTSSVGYLEIDDDFSRSGERMTTALYHGKRPLLYGENPTPRRACWPEGRRVPAAVRVRGESLVYI